MNNEEDVNLIALLKEALKFYADKENYLFYKDKDAPIAIDEGHQARFALKKVDELAEALSKIDNDYDNIMTNAIQSGDNPENVFKIMEDLKNIGDG